MHDPKALSHEEGEDENRHSGKDSVLFRRDLK